MNKNKIDELIEQWGNPQEAHRIYRLVLFDYYLTRCFELTDRKLENIKHYGISEKKAMINFLFICLNSVEENSYGLFEIFDRFKLVCGWSRRLLVVSHADIERLFVLIPEHLPNGNKWEKRPLNRRPKIWTALKEKGIADFIHDSSVGKYARMIDRGMEELLEKFAILSCRFGRQIQRPGRLDQMDRAYDPNAADQPHCCRCNSTFLQHL